jgi:hypothetical protein
MSTLVGFLAIFVAFLSIVVTAALVTPESNVVGPRAARIPASSAAIATSAHPAVSATPTPTSASVSSEPERYLWVMLLEITPPGEEFPTIITKREGAYVAPDRRREVAGGTTGNGQTWNEFAAEVEGHAWERAGGPTSTWTPLDVLAPVLVDAGSPPYRHLFDVVEGVLERLKPVEELDEVEGIPALRYDLTLDQLPLLEAYLIGRLNDAQSNSEAEELLPVAVTYWLRASDSRPLRIQISPAARVLPDVRLSFNIRLSNIDDPAIVIEDPASLR